MTRKTEEYGKARLTLNINEAKYICIGGESAKLDIGEDQNIGKVENQKYLVDIGRGGKY